MKEEDQERRRRVRMKISLGTNFSSASPHFCTNYFHCTCKLIHSGLVSSDIDDRSLNFPVPPDVPYCSKRRVRHMGPGTTA